MFSRLKKILSRTAVICLLASLPAGALTGCGKEELPFAYNPDYEVSSYRVVNEVSSVVADSFADDLCVVIGDVGTENGAVDMSEATAAGQPHQDYDGFGSAEIWKS